jgi:Fur family ferric uptake transcriptional regulator
MSSVDKQVKNSTDIRDKGLRLTPQRESVLNAVRELGHSTPEEITEKINQQLSGVNLSTIYRNLETLENSNLVQHTHVGHGASIYHPVEKLDHFHLTCGQCGSRIDADKKFADEFVQLLINEFDFEADITHFPIEGFCTNCRFK